MTLQNEEKVRRLWLLSFYILITYLLMSTVIINIQYGTFTKLEPLLGTALRFFIMMMSDFLLMVPFLWITYHCSYKKRGTAWLMCIMILVPIWDLTSFWIGYWNQMIGWVLGVKMTIALVVDAFFWVNCYRLYKVNFARKHKKPITS